MKILNDFRGHLKFRLDDAKLESLIEFYLMAMGLMLLFHIFMQLLPEVEMKIRSINILIDWVLALIVALSFLLWKLKKFFTKAVFCIQFGLYAGFFLALISGVVTYISILVPATSYELLLKLAPIFIFITYFMISYLFVDKFKNNTGPSVAVVIVLSSIVSYFKSFGLYLLTYFGLPLAILLNIYFIITLIYVARNELAMSTKKAPE